MNLFASRITSCADANEIKNKLDFRDPDPQTAYCFPTLVYSLSAFGLPCVGKKASNPTTRLP
jgi:hypothetical protein